MKKAAAIMIMTLLLVPTAISAQQKGGVDLKSVAEVEVVRQNAKGEKEVKRVDAAKANVVPGDTVIFTITYVNNGDKPAANVAVKNPVPGQMLYLDKSAEGAGTSIDFSVDKGRTYGSAGALKVKTSDGKERPAAAADITHIRWTLEKPVTPGATGSVSFRAKVK